MTDSNDKITIMVLSYNNFTYYKQCFKSILDQTYDNIEIVVSDDGSECFDKQELIDFINKNNRGNIKNIVINRNPQNIGIVKNYNKAISLSSGEYFFYLAIDDVLYDNEVIKDVVKHFDKTGELIFTGYKDVYDCNMDKYIKTLPRENEVEFLKSNNSKLLYERLCIGSFISGSNTPFSRKLVEKYGYLDEDYFYLEDYPKYLKLTKAGCNIGFIDRKLIKYRMGGVTTGGIINNYLRRDLRLTAEKECKEYYLKVWKDINIGSKKLIGWGSGDCFIKSLDKIKSPVAYLVDSNKAVQNTELNGISIYSPNNLSEENKDDIFVLVFSYANYFDIARELEKMGFKEKENYFCCTPDMLDIIGGI